MKTSLKILLVVMVVSLIALPMLLVDGVSGGGGECTTQKGDTCDCFQGGCYNDSCDNECAITTKSGVCFCSNIPD